MLCRIRNAMVNRRNTNSSFMIAFGVKYHKVPFSVIKSSHAIFCLLHFPEFLIVLFDYFYLRLIERHRIRERCFMYVL